MKAFLERYHKRKATEQLTPPEAPPLRNTSNDGTSEHHPEELNLPNQLAPPQSHLTSNASEDIGTSKHSVNEINIEDLPGDPGLAKTLFAARFNVNWFKDHPSWLEYSIEKDVAYCLHCYLFKPNIGDQAGGDVFVGTGFNNWKKKDKLKDHFLKWHSDKVDDIKKVVLKNAPRNHQLTSPDIQHDIVKAAATETLNVIIRK
ncbi:hypothetical protein ABKV19_017106 [Rosa sericea]